MSFPTGRPQILHEQGVTVVAFGPGFERITENAIAIASDALNEAAEADPPRVVVDLSCTQFFASSFIESVFRLWRRLQSREGGRFGLAGLTPYCLEVLQAAKLDHLWATYPTRDEAIRALNA
jgi:anti-anti-sigma regulatory factor